MEGEGRKEGEMGMEIGGASFALGDRRACAFWP